MRRDGARLILIFRADWDTGVPIPKSHSRYPGIMKLAYAMRGNGIRVAKAGAHQDGPSHHVPPGLKFQNYAMLAIRQSAQPKSGLVI